MNYEHHYNKLCERARNRKLDCYTESHHVIPRCMGGSDDPENLVNLTPEEHYVAHQLLVKMYPDHQGLIWAAVQMTGHGNGERSNNKMYGWLRRKWSKECKKRKGKKNGSRGRSWYHDPETLDNIKCLPEEVPEGYVKGRKLKPNKRCVVCGLETPSRKAKYCEEHFKRVSLTNRRNAIQKAHQTPLIGKKNGSYGRSWFYNPETLDNIKCLPEEVPEGYVKGRHIKHS